MNNLLVNYASEVEFEELEVKDLTIKKIESLEVKKGIIILTKTTNLWVLRELSIHSILNQNVVMESINSFSILDNFGIQMWNGDSNSILEFVEGFTDNKEI